MSVIFRSKRSLDLKLTRLYKILSYLSCQLITLLYAATPQSFLVALTTLHASSLYSPANMEEVSHRLRG